MTVLPGLIATRMTEGMDLSARLMARPGDVANAVVQAAEKGRDILYVPAVCRLLMFIIRALPEIVFTRTHL